MAEQDTKTLQGTDDAMPVVEDGAERQAQESEAPPADLKAESSDAGASTEQGRAEAVTETAADDATMKGESGDAGPGDAAGSDAGSEMVTEVSAEFAETATGRDAGGESVDPEAEGEAGEPASEADGEVDGSMVLPSEPSEDTGGGTIQQHPDDVAAESEGEANIVVEAGVDERPVQEQVEPEDRSLDYDRTQAELDEGLGAGKAGADDGDGSAGDASGEAESFPPEATIGVSAVETLPDDSGKETAGADLVDDATSQGQREAADQAGQPDIANEPGAERLPSEPDSTSSDSASASLDVMDIAGDADASEPDEPAPDSLASGDADASDPANFAPDTDPVPDQSSLSSPDPAKLEPVEGGTERPGVIDPVADAIAEHNPAIISPEVGAAVVDTERSPGIDPRAQGGGEDPVTDSSGIQLGSDSGTYSDGSQWWTFESADGSQQKVTLYPDGSSTNETLSADGSTHTTTEYDKDGKEVETTTTTEHEDGSRVTEMKKPDGSGTETHSDGTQIVYKPDGTAEVVEEPEDDDEEQEPEDDDEPEPEDDDEEDDDSTDAPSNDTDEASASRPINDGLVDQDKLAAMHQSEADFQQSVRESSTINPVRVDVGTAEGGGEPLPGVDDPPEDEAPRPGELPDDDPAEIGASGGNIDFGPDHIDENEAGTGGSGVPDAAGAQSSQAESAEDNPAGAEPELALDPAAMIVETQDILDALAGIAPDSGLGFWRWGDSSDGDADDNAEATDDGDDLF